MNTCPDCGSRANPLQLIAITSARPYRCKNCGNLSRLRRSHNTIGSLFVLALIPACFWFWPQLGALGTAALLVAGGLVLSFLQLFFMRLEPAAK
jgi:DNA-directed RNA polymerase subunit RPC12/RpoP